MRDLLESSLTEKKGLMIFMNGQSVAGAVVKIADDFVELRSREYSRIVVRIDSIDAAALA